MIEIQVPASKSLTQRALIMAALGRERCKIQSPLDCDDSRALSRGLRAIGCEVEIDRNDWSILPPPKFEPSPEALFLENAGTAVRFLSGLAPLIHGTFTVDGNWHHWVCAVRPAKGRVSLEFHKGVLLDDPDSVLVGNGRYLRRFTVPDGQQFDPSPLGPLVIDAIEKQTDMLE